MTEVPIAALRFMDFTTGFQAVDCPVCGAGHTHTWGGQRLCGQCGTEYLIAEPTPEQEARWRRKADGE